MLLRQLVFAALALVASLAGAAEKPRCVSGIYPHLAMFNNEGECGTGAVVVWADRLWAITYAPHKPTGSSDKLYEVTSALEQVVRPESIGGTPANRMIHRESQQLFIGPYAIDASRQVRVITPAQMFGRLTGTARHLTDPAGKICFATMEEGIYEVDVKTLAVTELWADEQRKTGRHSDLPGYHGKGFYSAQGRYVYANNGDHAGTALSNPSVPSGVLAEWDGNADRWTIVRRNQFTDVTGPGGIEGNTSPEDSLWGIGWDHRSLMLMLLDGGKWHTFRLPKASHSYDGAHGWNTEWPRIRDIGEDHLLMTMHGSFWKFPRTFRVGNTAGIVPRSNYIKVVGDFCRWGDRLVLGCDDTAKSEFLNRHPLKGDLVGPGQSQSNLWFLEPPQLDTFGPPLGRGAVWMNDTVAADTPSEPYLFSGFACRSLHLAHQTDAAATVTLEVDAQGDGTWRKLQDVELPADGHTWVEFPEHASGAWVRLIANRVLQDATAFFHYRGNDPRTADAAPIFAGLATPADTSTTGGLLYARGGNQRTLRVLATRLQGLQGCYDLSADLKLTQVDDQLGCTWMQQHVAISPSVITVDEASVLYVDKSGRRWRLPKGDAAFGKRGILGAERVGREVCTERNLLNIHGTFYELPAENAGGFPKLRPIATHNRRIQDFTSYRGLLVMTGVADTASGDHIVRSEDGKCAVWVGAVDDLWQLGKPRGAGGPWHNTPVKASEPSDPYLSAGYDHKQLTLSHDAAEPVTFTLEADFTGTGAWSRVCQLDVPPAKSLEYKLPDSFGAYWLRLVSTRTCTATARFDFH